MSAKFKAVAKIAKEKHQEGQPVLIGTTSIEKSEALSLLLTEEGVPHQVLNAKQHEKEAEIVAEAGQRGAITIATNMAGRGTDIKLGEEFQTPEAFAFSAPSVTKPVASITSSVADPAARDLASQFFVSMEDDLMRLFGGDRLKTMMERLQVPDDVPLENSMVSRAIESAQKKVEGRNFDIRRHVLQYDDVMNKHRGIIYTRRQKILEKIAFEEKDGARLPDGRGTGTSNSGNGFLSLHDDILESLRKEADNIVIAHARGEDSDTWDKKGDPGEHPRAAW